MSQTDFSFEFLSEIAQPDERLRIEAEDRLRKLTEGHKDIVGASVALEELTSSETPHRYQARIVIYMRPKDIATKEKAADPMTALQHALTTAERHVREYREKLRERWKQP